MTKGKIGKWLVKEGDTVIEGQPLLEIETDKVVHEQESPYRRYYCPDPC